MTSHLAAARTATLGACAGILVSIGLACVVVLHVVRADLRRSGIGSASTPSAGSPR